MNEENARLRRKLGMAENEASGAQQDRHALEAEVMKTKKMLDAAKSGRVVSSPPSNDDATHVLCELFVLRLVFL